MDSSRDGIKLDSSMDNHVQSEGRKLYFDVSCVSGILGIYKSIPEGRVGDGFYCLAGGGGALCVETAGMVQCYFLCAADSDNKLLFFFQKIELFHLNLLFLKLLFFEKHPLI